MQHKIDQTIVKNLCDCSRYVVLSIQFLHCHIRTFYCHTRIIGTQELAVGTSVRPSSTISNIFSSKTAWPIKAKFYVEPPWVGRTKVCSWHLGHMTKMAATPIYGKNPLKIFFSRTGGPISTKLGM